MKPDDESKSKLVYIPTASMAFSKLSTRKRGEQRRRNRYDAKQRMAVLQDAYGLETEMLNLDDPQLNIEDTKKTLSESTAAIYVDGGNTFYLKQHMERSGFREIIQESMENGMVYMGASAGAICAGQSIGTAYWKGWDSVGSAEEWEGWKEWTVERERGLGIVNFDIFPHYQKESHLSLVEEKREDHPYKVKICSDETAIVQSFKNSVLRSFDLNADGSMENYQMQKID